MYINIFVYQEITISVMLTYQYFFNGSVWWLSSIRFLLRLVKRHFGHCLRFFIWRADSWAWFLHRIKIVYDDTETIKTKKKPIIRQRKSPLPKYIFELIYYGFSRSTYTYIISGNSKLRTWKLYSQYNETDNFQSLRMNLPYSLVDIGIFNPIRVEK